MSRKEGWIVAGLCAAIFICLWIYAGNGFAYRFLFPAPMGSAVLWMLFRRR